MSSFFAESDALIISLKPKFDLTIPAKFQAYIAAGRPIIGFIRGDAATLITQYDLGITTDPSNKNAIKQAFITMCESPQTDYLRWSKNALMLSAQQFNRKKSLTR